MPGCESSRAFFSTRNHVVECPGQNSMRLILRGCQRVAGSRRPAPHRWLLWSSLPRLDSIDHLTGTFFPPFPDGLSGRRYNTAGQNVVHPSREAFIDILSSAITPISRRSNLIPCLPGDRWRVRGCRFRWHFSTGGDNSLSLSEQMSRRCPASLCDSISCRLSDVRL
jgi:hypothetical protein